MHSHCVGVTSQVDAVNTNTYNYLYGLSPVPYKRHYRLEEWLSHREEFLPPLEPHLVNNALTFLTYVFVSYLIDGKPAIYKFQRTYNIIISRRFYISYKFNIELYFKNSQLNLNFSDKICIFVRRYQIRTDATGFPPSDAAITSNPDFLRSIKLKNFSAPKLLNTLYNDHPTHIVQTLSETFLFIFY